MKTLLILAAVFTLTASADSCSSKKTTATYKARLETKALCMNYTLTLIEGNLDSSLVVPKWTDENTGKSFTNAFGLADPCKFPKNIAEGDEFYFVIDSTKGEPCAVCMAYYPTPQKKLSIKVVEK
jgi:hypothetical protein